MEDLELADSHLLLISKATSHALRAAHLAAEVMPDGCDLSGIAAQLQRVLRDIGQLREGMLCNTE